MTSFVRRKKMYLFSTDTHLVSSKKIHSISRALLKRGEREKPNCVLEYFKTLLLSRNTSSWNALAATLKLQPDPERYWLQGKEKQNWQWRRRVISSFTKAQQLSLPVCLLICRAEAEWRRREVCAWPCWWWVSFCVRAQYRLLNPDPQWATWGDQRGHASPWTSICTNICMCVYPYISVHMLSSHPAMGAVQTRMYVSSV